jgi:hypothetical protein
MPQGLRNAPSIQQRHITAALCEHIGKICHVYLDDIVIRSDNVEEHEQHVHIIFDCLKAAGLYCNKKKTKLFQLSIKFLGHKISAKGIEANDSKVERILHWPTPKSSTNVRAFLGVVWYISQFLPNLAAHTEILHCLTTKAADKCFPSWAPEHEATFQAIKEIVISRDCLTTINHHDMGDNKIFVTANASDVRSGVVLSYGPTWETARPVAFDSITFKGAELNYPVHE